MNRSKLGLKALGLCAMLVGMFALASVAQAEVGSFWLVSGAKISESLKPLVEAKTDVEGSLLTVLGGKEVHLRCPTINLVESQLLEPNGKILGKIDYKGCKFFALEAGVEVEKKACEPKNEGVAGLIVTNLITGLIVLHTPTGGVAEPVIEIVPDNGGTLFVTLSFGELCALGELFKIGNGKSKTGEVLTSKLFLKDCQGKFLTDLREHLVEELPSLTKLFVNGGETAAALNGSDWLFLGGAHAGLTFAAHAG